MARTASPRLRFLPAPVLVLLLAAPSLAAPPGLEVRWGDGRALQTLPFTQSRREPLLRARYELLIPPGTLPPSPTSLRIELPPRFDGRLLPASVHFCRMVTRPQVATTRCAEVLPSRVEAAGPGQLRLVLQRPPAPEALHGLTLLLFNPSLDGRYPLRLWADPAGTYVGTWLLPIETDSD